MEENPEFLDVSLVNFEGDVDEQVASLLDHVRLSRGEVVGLRNLLADLERALRAIWPDCEVQPFGSIVTGLGIKSSDVDVYVKINSRYRHRPSPVMLARNILRQSPWIFNKVFAIPAAKVPIVKFLHIPTGCNCDVNFNSESGVRNSKLIFHLLKTDSKALTLAIIIKYWSKVYGFTGTNLLSSYALTMMVIFYLQGVNMLAPVWEIQRFAEPVMVEGWNCAFDKSVEHPRAYNDNIYHLLGGFFKYFSYFSFDQYVVSTFLGTPILRSIFKSPKQGLHNEYSLYKEHLDAGLCKPLRIDSLMCIQDPFDHSRNCSVAVSPKLFSKLQMHFQYAARMYDQRSPDEFLQAVFTQVVSIQRVAIDSSHKHVVHTTFKSKKQKNKKKMNSVAANYLKMQKMR